MHEENQTQDVELPCEAGASKSALPFILLIGASAGGLDPIKTLIERLPIDCPFAVVVIQHLSSEHRSMMKDLLQARTKIPVHVVEQDMQVEPGRIYLNPNRYNIALKHGESTLSFRLFAREENQVNLPIDLFVRSLGEAVGDRSIAVILSGTGSDGSNNLARFRAKGGFCMIQLPQSAKYDGMPNSAISGGQTDLVLPVEQIVDEAYRRREYILAGLGSTEQAVVSDERNFQKIIKLVSDEGGIDFFRYKRATLQRRLSRRISQLEFPDLKLYLAHLSDTPEEVSKLRQELLVGVTHFFRDAKAWELLEKHSIRPLFEESDPEAEPAKAWCVGCSTGEEPYTLAIFMEEARRKADSERSFKIFASDLQDTSLEYAKQGVYPKEIADNVPPEHLTRYFEEHPDGYQVRPFLRHCITFVKHDATTAAPFTQTDLLVCRNMLIYLSTELQDRTRSLFSFSLKVGGTLFLGPSESLGEAEGHFATIDQKWNIFRSLKRAARIDKRIASYMTSTGLAKTSLTATPKTRVTTPLTLADPIAKAFVEFGGACAATLDQDFRIIETQGNFRDHFPQRDGIFETDLLALAPESLSPALSLALRNASQGKSPAKTQARTSLADGTQIGVEIHVYFFPDDLEESYSFSFLVCLHRQSLELPATTPKQDGATHSDPAYVQALELELAQTKDELKSRLGDFEAANEELHTSNEELMSSNEELQSSNEEMQSINEELHTVNAEHQQKIQELRSLNADMDNLLSSTEIATLFLDSQYSIRKFTPAITHLFKLNDSDIGRPITAFAGNWTQTSPEVLLADIALANNQGELQARQIRTREGKWYQMRVSPFRNALEEIDGTVITFLDIHDLTIAKDELAEKTIALENVLEGTLAGYWDWNLAENTEYLSPSFKSMFGYEDHEMENSPESWQKIIHPDDLPSVFKTFEKHVASKGKHLYDNEVRYYHKDGSIVWVWCRGKVIEWSEKDEPLRMVGSHVDITKLKNAITELNSSREESQNFSYIVSHDLREPLNTVSNFVGLLEDANETEKQEYLQYITEATQRLKNMISGLLDYSLLKQEQIQSSAVDMNQVAKAALEDLRSSIDETEAKITVDDLPPAEGDPDILRQISQNLISNALKYTAPGKPPELRISAKPDGALVRYTFTDQGCGIDPENHETIFGIFRRAHLQGDIPGLGLGLAFCKKAAELHKGTITIESAPGEGSTFTLNLPAATDQAQLSV